MIYLSTARKVFPIAEYTCRAYDSTLGKTVRTTLGQLALDRLVCTHRTLVLFSPRVVNQY
jgi:hypothetical protein